MEKAAEVLLRSIAPTVMFSLVLALLFLARDIDSLRRRWPGRLYLILVFGLISVPGLLGRVQVRNAILDPSVLVVLVAGLYGGFAVGVGSAAAGTAVKLMVLPRLGAHAFIAIVVGALGAAVHHARKGRPVPPAGDFDAGTGAGLLQGILTAALMRAPILGEEVLAASVPLGLLTGLGTMLFIAVLQYLQGIRERARLEDLMARTRLEFLQAQLRPHFLFNALNTVGSVCRTDPEAARGLIRDLAELLRAVLKTPEKTIPLRDEMKLVDAYLGIEQARYPDRLEVSRSVDENCLDFRVPPLFIQPLLENAVIHGMPDEGRLRIRLAVERGADGAFSVRVEDDGRGLGENPDPKGIGLANVGERLELVYGGRARLRVESRPGEGTRVTIDLPHDPDPGR